MTSAAAKATCMWPAFTGAGGTEFTTVPSGHRTETGVSSPSV